LTEYDEMGPGEIRRGLERIEKQLSAMQQDVSTRYNELANKMVSALGPISELKFRLEKQDDDLIEIAGKVRVNEGRLATMELRAAAVAGGVVAVFSLVKFLLGR
jgi:hypothetical protein